MKSDLNVVARIRGAVADMEAARATLRRLLLDYQLMHAETYDGLRTLRECLGELASPGLDQRGIALALLLQHEHAKLHTVCARLQQDLTAISVDIERGRAAARKWAALDVS